MKPSRGKARGFDTTTLLRCFLLFFHPLATCNSLFVRTKRRKMANPYKANLSGCSCTLTQLCYFSFFFFLFVPYFQRDRVFLSNNALRKKLIRMNFSLNFAFEFFLKYLKSFRRLKQRRSRNIKIALRVIRVSLGLLKNERNGNFNSILRKI